MIRVEISRAPNPAWAEVAFAPYRRELVDIVRGLRQRRWNGATKRWSVPLTALDDLIPRLQRRGVSIVLAPELSGTTRIELRTSVALASGTDAEIAARAEAELTLRQYSPKTRRAYLRQIRRFLAAAPGEPITMDRLRAWLLDQVEHGISTSYHGQLVSALRFLSEHVLGDRSLAGDIPTPKRSRTLPAVLSVREVKRLLLALRNPKHRLMALLLYSSGVRVGELVRLRLEDFDSDRGMIRIRHGKGDKDRYTLCAENVTEELAAFLAVRGEDPGNGYLFTGKRADRPITARSVEKVITAAASRAGIGKRVTPHTLRHSFATHLLEQGVGLRHIQELLGHASARTTQVYTHVTREDLVRIRSPLDTLGLDRRV